MGIPYKQNFGDPLIKYTWQKLIWQNVNYMFLNYSLLLLPAFALLFHKKAILVCE